MHVPRNPRQAVWICSIVSLSFFITLYYVYTAGYLQYNPHRVPTTNLVASNCHKRPGSHTHNRNDADNENKRLPLLLAELWKPLVHPLTDREFVTDKGERFEVPPDQLHWKKKLGQRVLLLDTDTRLDKMNENTMLHECPLYFPTLPGRTGGHLNHYIYAMIHGYDYRLVRAADYPDRHGTWVKPAIVKEALKTHDIVVSLDSDAVFTHLDLPLEWLMNLWDVTPATLVAMAVDLDWKGDYDPQGNLILNTGFVIAQASQRSQDMFERWEDCPRSIPGCDHWNFKWAHEQAAFSWYIRYEFNQTNDVKNIPCNHANGNEYAHNGKCECQGVFVSHNWKNKDKTPELLSRSIMTSLARRVHSQFKNDIDKLFIDASNETYPIENFVI